ncbi:hypothetical protein VTK56DRAFT_3446 [Thermocarpiscus australiensis]
MSLTAPLSADDMEHCGNHQRLYPSFHTTGPEFRRLGIAGRPCQPGDPGELRIEHPWIQSGEWPFLPSLFSAPLRLKEKHSDSRYHRGREYGRLAVVPRGRGSYH